MQPTLARLRSLETVPAFRVLAGRAYADHDDPEHVLWLRRGAEAGDAEEAVQDAFLCAFRALGRYEDRERLSAWLTRILINQCRTIRARVQRQPPSNSALMTGENLHVPPALAPSRSDSP